MDWDVQWWANLASVLTFFITLVGAAVGVYGYFNYLNDFARKHRKLEQYLREEKKEGEDSGQRSLLNIMRHVGLTEDETLKISFASKHIERRLKEDAEGFADKLLFEYVGKIP